MLGAGDVDYVICDSDTCRATVVSDLNSHFNQSDRSSLHYEIDVSLRKGVGRISCEEAAKTEYFHARIFLVIEQYEKVPATSLDNGEYFLIDTWYDGKEIIEGGCQGEKSLMAVRTGDGAWPDFSPGMHAVNTVLAAVKVGQDTTHYFDPLYSCSCFVTDDNRAVYPCYTKMSVGYGGARVIKPIDSDSLSEKVLEIRSIHEGLCKDALVLPQVAELIDSVLLYKTQDDGYYRLWFLRLWQALADSKRLLGSPKLENESEIIAGRFSPTQLKKYRHAVAHWWTGKVDFSYVTGIQQTVHELLRRKYQ